MSTATAFALADMLTNLTGKKVSVSDASDLSASDEKKVFGVYDTQPDRLKVLLSTDLMLLAGLGGALMGLPQSVVVQRISENPIDELLRDAMYEVLNITSSVISSTRAVLRAMEMDPSKGFHLKRETLEKPHMKSRFQVQVAGYFTGELALMIQI